MIRIIVGPDDRLSSEIELHEARTDVVDFGSSCLVIDSMPVKHYVDISDSLKSYISEESLKDIQWYYETYPIHDPFGSTRAEGVVAQLKLQGEDLVRRFFRDDILSPDLRTEDLEIWVKSCQDNVAFKWLDLLCWELLEDLSIWQVMQNGAPRTVKVVRIFEAFFPRPGDNDRVPDAGGKRILAITARPALNDDVPHRLITRAILRAIQKYSSANPHTPPVLEIVRPGTLEALIARLESGNTFDIVHLDVHGYTDDKCSYVEFVRFNGFETVTDPVSAEDLAFTLAKHGVKRVFLNACRSAAFSTAQASVAQTLIKHGIHSVIGMSYNIGTVAAEIFVESFYLQYLQPNTTIVYATSAARRSMRRNKQRATKFDEMIQVDDHIVPILYQSRFPSKKDHLTLSSLNLQLETIEPDPVDLRISACIGRESHILDLESYISRGIPVLLHGQAGVGKTSLLDEVSWWWQSTGLIGDTVYIDAPELQASVIGYVRRQVALALTRPLKDFESHNFVQLADLVKEQKLLFIIDNLESLQPTDEQETLNLMRDIKQLLKPLRNHMLIIASRDLEDWLSSFIPYTHVLEGLDERDALKFGLSLVRELEPRNQELSRDDLRFFSLSLGLVAGVPLAIQLLIRMYKEYISKDPGFNCKKFYLRLLSIDVLNFQSASAQWARHEKGARCVFKIQDMIENGIRANSYGENVVSAASAEVMQDVLQLAPFWLYIPYEIEDYWLFLGMAMRRAVEGQEAAKTQRKGESSGQGSDLGPTFWASAFDDSEWEFMNGQTSSDRTRFNLMGEIKASQVWFQRIQEMSSLYLINGPVTKVLRGRQGSSTKQYYRVNPVFTLIARSYHRPNISYWHEVILGSFRRFMFSRVSQWASAGPSNWSWIPENDLAREEVQTDFPNFAASSRASIWTEGFQGEEWVFKQMSILNVAAADHEPNAWATLAIYDEYLNSTMGFVRQEKQKVTCTDGLALDESLFTETTEHAAKFEKYCIILLANCALLAQTADDASAEFKTQKNELQHLSLSNHPKYSTPEERSWNELCTRVGQRKVDFYENPNEKTLEECTIIMKEFKQQLGKRTFRAAEFWDPALAGTPIGEAFGRISVGGPNSFHGRYNTLSTSLSVYDDEMSVEQKRKEIEQCLQAEISGTNIPFNRWHLYYILAELCRLTGDSKVGRQHQDRCLALEKMIDPYLLEIQKKTMDFWLEYHGTHSWDLLDPPEEEDISEVVERLHKNTEASRLRYSASDLELQDDIFAEAGALEKVERYDEAAKLFSELPDKYRFTARSPISILGPQHHIAILLMQQEKYSEAALKLRDLLSQRLNQEQEAIASIGLAQCLFMQAQVMKYSQHANCQQLLSEAEKLAAAALQLRKYTYPSWHWHYLVPKRLYAQILTTLGSPAHVAECRRTMQEIQASIMSDVQDVNNRQRFANINHLANFLLRSRDFEEAEKVFEIMYISALLQKGEEDLITVNCERNLVAALRGQGIDCDVRFVRDFQAAKLAYQRWRQTVLRFPANMPMRAAFQKSTGEFMAFLIRHAGIERWKVELERFVEEHNALCERLSVLQAQNEA